jgi:nucleotide-binding universal stress UspA family protein
MTMFKDVLVGVDGRPNGRDAIALALRLRDPAGKLTLVHVRPGALRPLHAVAPSVVAAEREDSHTLLERERTAAKVTAELVSVVSMSPGRGLHQQAEQQGADLLVVGSCSHGLFGRARLGDDTRGSLNGSPCAVAIASRGYAERSLPIARIGVGYDGSSESETALAAARALATAVGAEVSALEVVALPTYAFIGIVATVTAETVDAMLAEAEGRLAALEGVDAHAVYGLTGEELAAFGDELDLLVVGSRSYGPWRRLVLGSTSEYLQRHARCSLLVLPRSAPDRDQAPPEDGARAQSALGMSP